MKIALAQMQMADDMAKNLQRSYRTMEKAVTQGAELICFPELQLTKFFPQHPKQDVAEFALHEKHPAFLEFCEKCRELSLIAVPNFYWFEGGNYYDASLVINADGSLNGISKMVHIADFPQFHEQDYYTPSDTGFRVYDTPIGKVGIVICFDRHYSESIRSCVLQGADIVIIPTANIIDEPLEMFEWEIRVPAMQNSVFIAMCNRTGIEDEMQFAGQSLVVGVDGEVLSKASDDDELLIADIDISKAKIRRNERPYLSLWRQNTF